MTVETLEKSTAREPSPDRWRRTLVVVLIGALAGGFAGAAVSGGDPPPTFAEAIADSDTVEVGTVLTEGGVEVSVLSAHLLRDADADVTVPFDPLEPDRFLHVVVKADLRGTEFLEITSGSFFGGTDDTGPRDGPRRIAPRATDAWIGFSGISPPDGERIVRDRIELKVLALTGDDGGAKGPGTHTRRECAEPLNANGVCELLKSEGRVLGTVTIDLRSLDLPPRFLQP